MTTYTAVCRRSGTWWAISVPELKGVHTQVKRLDQAEEMTREAVALFLDVAPESVGIRVEAAVPPQVTDALAARQAAAAADDRAAVATHEAVRALLAQQYTVRDIGSMLGISPQRVSQIAGRPKPAEDDKRTPQQRGAGTSVRLTA